eukprot:6751662-Ditylum_brightwellii.AAC.1
MAGLRNNLPSLSVAYLHHFFSDVRKWHNHGILYTSTLCCYHWFFNKLLLCLDLISSSKISSFYDACNDKLFAQNISRAAVIVSKIC